MAETPTKGLIIKSPYIEKILDGSKIWEMRSKATRIRGPIALIKQGSGQIVGVASLIDVKGPLSQQERIYTIDKHQIPLDQLKSGITEKWNFAWVLGNAQLLKSPIAYKHPNGAVIWVNLDRETQEKFKTIID
jgi:hypothetical protein